MSGMGAARVGVRRWDFAAGSSRTAAQAACLAAGGTFVDFAAATTAAVNTGALGAARYDARVPVALSGGITATVDVAVNGVTGEAQLDVGSGPDGALIPGYPAGSGTITIGLSGLATGPSLTAGWITVFVTTIAL